jgi:hypothetical protein
VTFMENMLETLVKSREAQQKRGDWRKLRKWMKEERQHEGNNRSWWLLPDKPAEW